MKRKRYPLFRSIIGILFGFVLIGYYLAAGFVGGFTVSVLWVWLAAGGTITLLGLADLWMWFHPIRPIRIAVAVLRWLIIVCAVWFFSVVGQVVSDMHYTCPVNADYLIVPGAKVYGDQPSDALLARIDLAWDYLFRNPDTVAILSGGQGSGENISEAECMFRALTAKGIAPERFWLEDKSTSTKENIAFSLALLQEKVGKIPEEIGILSSQYHLYRAGYFVREQGLQPVCIGAKTARIELFISYFVREIFAVCFYSVFG